MKTIFLLMKRQPIAQVLMERLAKESDNLVIYESDYFQAEEFILNGNVDIVLVEVAEAGEHDVHYCLAILSRVRFLGCKRLLICPEQDEECVLAAVEAKQKGQIEDFVFCDASIGDLTSKLLMDIER